MFLHISFDVKQPKFELSSYYMSLGIVLVDGGSIINKTRVLPVLFSSFEGEFLLILQVTA